MKIKNGRNRGREQLKMQKEKCKIEEKTGRRGSGTSPKRQGTGAVQNLAELRKHPCRWITGAGFAREECGTPQPAKKPVFQAISGYFRLFRDNSEGGRGANYKCKIQNAKLQREEGPFSKAITTKGPRGENAKLKGRPLCEQPI